MKFLSSLILFFLIAATTFAQEKYTAQEAAKHIGDNAIVTGIVAQVSTPKNGIIYLNFNEKYPDNLFTGVIFKKDAVLFPDVKELVGKKVELSGKIEEYKGKPQIILKKPDQIKIVE